MAGRSLQASAEGIQIIRKAINRDDWKQAELADALGLKTRQPITRLLRGEPIERSTFEELCHLLGVAVEDVAVLDEEVASDKPDVDALVREMRDAIQPLIQERCGTMRVLDMAQPVGLGEIYTHVNILERITARQSLKVEDLAAQMSSEDFERFSLGRVRETRVPGSEAVEQHSKLMILGKPGAGKTTFLKHLAMQCIGGQFQAKRVPLFVTLKEFAETEGTPDVLAYLERLIAPLKEPQTTSSKAATIDKQLQTLLAAGRVLVLLDGLDEVREADASRVLRQIKQFSERYARNVFVITCRIAARDYTFERFTEVEVADFDDAQIADVSGKWFRCKQDEVKAKRFLEALKAHPPIRDLASSPLLLTLLCLVFEDSGEFPANRAELYQTGVDVLLKKWDVKRNIERDQVYKKLSLRRKEDLLSHIAYRTFESGTYFFKQKDLERQIQEFIEHLPGASTDEQTLELDSEAVLKSIEAQHGLFVERARGIYSFSHLTFHEYFAAREIKEKALFSPLSLHITERRWREVTLLTVGMVPQADGVLQRIKESIDALLAKDERFQQFLVWLWEKSESTHTAYKPASIRAFYYALALALALDHALAPALDHALDHARALAPALDLDHALDHALDRARDRARDLDLDLDFALAPALDLDRAHARALAPALDLDRAHARMRAHARALYIDTDRDRALDHALDLIRERQVQNPGNAGWFTLLSQLELLREQIPNDRLSWEDQQSWWEENGQDWVDQLRAVMIEHRNIGHDWQFSNAQKQRLREYYEANRLLVACLNSDCYVSRGVREEIEETLLLPMVEIERRKAAKERDGDR